MKNFKLLLSVAATAVMFGCSSMEVDEPEAYSENLPADFSYTEYLAIHPILRTLQIQDYVADINATVDADTKTADIAAFEKDTAELHKFYLDPYMGGYTEEEWVKDMSSGVKLDTVPDVVEKRYLNLTVVDSSAEPAAIVKLTVGTWDNTAEKKYTAVGAVTFDAIPDAEDSTKVDSVITKVSGKNEAGALVEFAIGDKISLDSRGTKTRLDTVSVKVVETAVEGGVMPADKLKKLKNFNVWNTSDDYATVMKIAVLDTFAISYQYVAYGRMHYWAYRRCTESEKQKEEILVPNPADKNWVGATKFYCDDNGAIKEID